MSSSDVWSNKWSLVLLTGVFTLVGNATLRFCGAAVQCAVLHFLMYLKDK
jgi:hypothetical protein